MSTHEEASSMTHHADCDGFRTAEGATILEAGDGWLLDTAEGVRLPGFFRTIGQAEAEARRHQSMVPCNGECATWS